MKQDVKPTRSNLFEIEERIDLSERGHNLLEMKRDGLIIEFQEILEKAKGTKSQLEEDYVEAQRKLNVARAFEGDIELKSTAYTATESPSFHMRTKNIMGLQVPEMEAEGVSKPLVERGYGVIGTSSKIDEAVTAYEELVDSIIEAAEINAAINRMLEEIEKTNRRVNALEYNVIPDLKEASDYIEFRLEEMEREATFRIKRAKG